MAIPGIGSDIREVLEEVGTFVEIEGTALTEYVDYDFNVQVGNPFLREHMRSATLPHDTVIQAGNILYVPVNGERMLVVNFIPEMFENHIVTINSTFYKCNIFGIIYREEVVQDVVVTFNLNSVVIDSVGHGLENRQKVNFRSSGTLPGVISAGTEYYVIDSEDDSFSISETEDGTAIEFLTVGLGVHKVYKQIYTLQELTNRRMVWAEKDRTYAAFTSALRGNTSQIMDKQDFADLLVKHNLLYFPDNVDIRPQDRFWVSSNEYYTIGNVEPRRFNQCAVCDLTEDMRHNNYA